MMESIISRFKTASVVPFCPRRDDCPFRAAPVVVEFGTAFCSSCTKPMVWGYKFRRIPDSVCFAGWPGWHESPGSMIRCNQFLLCSGLLWTLDGPASDARHRSRRTLAVAPVADHDWPSRLLPRGFDPDISLCATLRWAKYSI